jgi:hypothetical protein
MASVVVSHYYSASLVAQPYSSAAEGSSAASKDTLNPSFAESTQDPSPAKPSIL